jgi:hypothetical protein
MSDILIMLLLKVLCVQRCNTSFDRVKDMLILVLDMYWTCLKQMIEYD